jgi:beta-lactam-binding protein with PASTA domain
MVTVPVFPQGTTQTDACNRLNELNLRCEAVEIGSGGPSGTVRDTQPSAGSRVPEHSVVRVQVYGAIPVPNVVSKRTDVACRLITDGNSKLSCAKQPMPGPAPNHDWSKLDFVAQQNPEDGRRVDAGSTVTVQYWDRTVMDNLAGKMGAAECGNIMTKSNNLVRCQIRQGTNAPSPDLDGTVTLQSLPAGGEVKIGDAVVLTIYRKSLSTVPGIPPGTPIDQACQRVRQTGYRCVPVADGSSPGSGVTSQQPPGGTPQEGGDVVVHYSPNAAVPLWLWRNNQFTDVWVIRPGDPAPSGNYSKVKAIGRAYPIGTSQSGVQVVNGFSCTSGASSCLGVSPNHYYTRDTANPHDWSGPGPIVNVLGPVNGQCPAGQTMIYRFGRFWSNSQQHRYYVDSLANRPAGYDFSEPLGCVWNP